LTALDVHFDTSLEDRAGAVNAVDADQRIHAVLRGRASAGGDAQLGHDKRSRNRLDRPLRAVSAAIVITSIVMYIQQGNGTHYRPSSLTEPAPEEEGSSW
jgi:hypothetical protein